MAGKLDAIQVQELNLRLTHEAAATDDDVIHLTNVDLTKGTPIRPTYFASSNLPDNVRIAEDTEKPKDSAAEQATADEDAKVPERKP